MTSADEQARRRKAFDAVKTAVGQYQRGEVSEEVCPFCAGTLIVEGSPAKGPPSAWHVHCPCGKCNTVFKGL